MKSHKRAEPTVREIRSGSSSEKKDQLIDTLIAEVCQLRQELILAKQMIGAMDMELTKIHGRMVLNINRSLNG